MASEFDEADFIDSDFQAAKKSGLAPSAAGGTARPPTREELEAKVGETQQRLNDLKRQQEELERERAALEEARRRRTEYQVGREEMLENLTRGIGLLEEGEFAARRDAEQMAKTLGELRDALIKVQSLNEQAWTQDNYPVELTRALTTIENARMEWNAAQLKWPVLTRSPQASADPPAAERPWAWLFEPAQLWSLCKIGLALTWPLAAVGLLTLVLLVVVLLRQ